eukprot:5947175-Prymnesium_polylepis.1
MAATMEGNVLGSAVQPITAYPAAAQSILTQPVSNVSGPATVAQPAAANIGGRGGYFPPLIRHSL